MPGEFEVRMRKERRAKGIEIDDKTWDQLLDAADAIGVPRAEIETLAGIKH